MPPKKNSQPKNIETFTYDEASRKNIPTAEFQLVMEKSDEQGVPAHYARRNRDLDPQLVWRGKDEQDWFDLVVNAPPLYIQEKVHPKVLIDDLIRQSETSHSSQATNHSNQAFQPDLFADFNGLLDNDAKTEFYQHDANWTNRMILGDSLQVMASLAEREGLQGKVQCIYLDPPTASNSTPISSGPPPAATSRTAKPTPSPANRKWSKPSATTELRQFPGLAVAFEEGAVRREAGW